MKAIILDFEATDSSEEAQATEIAVMDVAFKNGVFEYLTAACKKALAA